MKEFFKKLLIFRRVKKVEEENALLRQEVKELREELNKRTISQKTMQQDNEPVSTSQILSEWLNGEEGANG